MPLLDNLLATLTQRDPLPLLVPERVWDNSLTAKIDKLTAAPPIKADTVVKFSMSLGPLVRLAV